MEKLGDLRFNFMCKTIWYIRYVKIAVPIVMRFRKAKERLKDNISNIVCMIFFLIGITLWYAVAYDRAYSVDNHGEDWPLTRYIISLF